MVYDSLTSLIESAKSVFQPRNDNDLRSFENYIFNNYINNNMDLESVDEEVNEEEAEHNRFLLGKQHISDNSLLDEIPNNNNGHSLIRNGVYKEMQKSVIDKKLKRISMVELSKATNDEEFSSSNLQRFSSMQSLKHSNSVSNTTPLVVIQGPTSTGRRSISPSRRSAGSNSNSSSTAKYEFSSTAASTAAATVSITSIAPTEKEKKPKEVSSSRVKKFHRHFSQVSKDEKLINYFSCALVSDILLQGHLYITDKHFAFYSNVFGYVTKVVIPTSSVTKISKEKTAKIIPNAVGVATADERHVFGSFISREAAFRLMCSVCPPLAPVALLPKDPASLEISEEYSIEDDSSCSISGNESPAQIIENSSNANVLDMVTTAVHNDSSQTLLKRHISTSSNLSINEESSNKQLHSDIPLNAKTSASFGDLHKTQIGRIRSLATGVATAHFNTTLSPINNNNSKNNENSFSYSQSPCSTLLTESTNTTTTTTVSSSSSGVPSFGIKLIAGTLSTSTSTPSPSTPSSPTTVIAKPSTKLQRALKTFHACINNLLLRIKYPTELHVVYMGVVLTLLLTVFTIFLLYRILDIEAKTSTYRSPIEFNWRSGNDDDIFVEALRFQKELQHKTSEEAQIILKTNLEQIAKVRRSLEALSMLIQDRRRSSFDYPHSMNNHDDPND